MDTKFDGLEKHVVFIAKFLMFLSGVMAFFSFTYLIWLKQASSPPDIRDGVFGAFFDIGMFSMLIWAVTYAVVFLIPAIIYLFRCLRKTAEGKRHLKLVLFVLIFSPIIFFVSMIPVSMSI